jgi:hemerythrin
MEKIKVANGIFWVAVPEADIFILCGCPADAVKHLMKRGLIIPKSKDGVVYESGPNAILLSDVSIQNGSFSNLAEFPVLQMLYRQGMIIPGHPNNTGNKPILIGTSYQIAAQSQYIYRGNFGLTSIKEITDTGIPEAIAKEMLRLKKRFAFNKILKTEDILDFCTVDTKAVEIRNGVYVKRKELNVYEFEFKGETVEVNLNLESHEEYEPTTQLGFHKINREYFSVIHIGEGDGWDVNRPCMSSIITFQGKIYLIDTGPHILHSLTALGISVNEIEGIFHTHGHDDHFAGLTSLVRSDHLIKYYTPAVVRVSIVKKLASLMSISEERFKRLFEIHTLHFNRWNNIDGLEVKPVYSPHPVEDAFLIFRTYWEGGYKTYAHLSDITSLSVLQKYLIDDKESNEISKKIFSNLNKNYFYPADIKKIDIGGGTIHGRALDFIKDRSNKIILSHTSRNLSIAEKEIGSNATFGMEDVLIPAHQDYCMRSAYRYLRAYFPLAPDHDLAMLLNCPVQELNVGLILLKKGVMNTHVYLIITGGVEYIDAKSQTRNILSAGSIIGEEAVLSGEPPLRTYRAMSYIKVLKISCELYKVFLNRNFMSDDIKRIFENKLFLQNTWLFGEMVSSVILNSIAKLMRLQLIKEGEKLSAVKTPTIYMLKTGEVQVFFEDKQVDTLKSGGFFGEESIFLKQADLFTARASKDSSVYVISGDILQFKPIIEWKLLETFEKRLRTFGTQLEKNI